MTEPTDIGDPISDDDRADPGTDGSTEHHEGQGTGELEPEGGWPATDA